MIFDYLAKYSNDREISGIKVSVAVKYTCCGPHSVFTKSTNSEEIVVMRTTTIFTKCPRRTPCYVVDNKLGNTRPPILLSKWDTLYDRLHVCVNYAFSTTFPVTTLDGRILCFINAKTISQIL